MTALDPLADVPCTLADDPLADVPCTLADDPHPDQVRRAGLRLAGRWAALEVTAVAAAFATCALVDAALDRIATARGVVRHTIRNR